MTLGDVPDIDATADRLHSVAIRLLRRVRIEDAKSGLSPSRLSTLSVVVYRGPLRLGELAEAEQVRPPTMSKTVQALEDDDLVERRTDPDDRRSILIEATDGGRHLLVAARKRRLKRLRMELADLSSEEQGLVAAAVDVLFGLFVLEKNG